MIRPTASQLYNAGVAMNLAKGTAEHGARSQGFMALFEHARPWTRLAAGARIIAWRLTSERTMRGAAQ